jgi:hypothetical protein
MRLTAESSGDWAQSGWVPKSPMLVCVSNPKINIQQALGKPIALCSRVKVISKVGFSLGGLV